MHKEIKVKDKKFFEDCFKFANYITLSQNYLNSFVNFDEKLQISNLKDRSFGHWGACPSINFLYLHLINFFKKHNLKANILVGTGHAGSSVSANLWLTNSWFKVDHKYPNNFEGLGELIKEFGANIRSEVNPEYPTTLYDGGELGYSLAFAYGYCLNSEIDILPCIIGDGECETATLMASWQLNKVKKSNKVLPIINLNKYKMCSTSTFAKMSKNEIKSFFKSFGFEPLFCSVNHKKIEKTLEKAYKLLKNDKKSPVIIFKSNKGLTGLCDGTISIEGNILSHKDPLAKLAANEKVEILNKWKDKYKFNLTESKLKEIIDFYDYDFFVSEKDLLPVKLECDANLSTFENLENSLKSLMQENKIYIFSPDEINSNKLAGLNCINKNILELLSENVLEGVFHGYAQAGNNGLFVTYEAFASVFISMVSQYQKYIYQSEVAKRCEKPSLNFILTSTAFENTYSHQNPEFVSALLYKNYENVHCFYPTNSNALLKNLSKCLNSKNQINVITISKNIKNKSNLNRNSNDVIYLNRCKNADVIYASTGDYLFSQQLRIKEFLDKNQPNLKIKYVYINNLDVLKDNKRIKEIFGSNKVVYTYMGYQSVLKNLLFEISNDIEILGYKDKSIKSTNIENKLKINEMGDEQIIKLLTKKEPK